MIMKHVTIHTNELEKSAGFYMELCGLDIVREINGKKHIMFLAEKKGETCIELIDDSKMQYSGCGLSIGFEVWDAEKYREELIRNRHPHVCECGNEMRDVTDSIMVREVKCPKCGEVMSITDMIMWD